MANLKITYDKNDLGKIRKIEAKVCLSLTVNPPERPQGSSRPRRGTVPHPGNEPEGLRPLLLFHDTEEQLNHVDEIVLKGQHNLTVRRTGPGCFHIEHTYGAPLQPGQEASPQLDSPYSFAQGTRKDHEGTIILERRKPPKSRKPAATQS